MRRITPFLMTAAVIIASGTLLTDVVDAAPPGTIQDEAQVPPYVLPEVLKSQSGEPVDTAEKWMSQRRPELVQLITENVFGKAPQPSAGRVKFVLREEKKGAREGKATRLRVGVLFNGEEGGPQMEMLVYLPADATKEKPVPLFWGLNFNGNFTCTLEADIPLPQHWVRSPKSVKAGTPPREHPNRAHEEDRGHQSERWQIDMALARGYGVATACYCEIEADDDGQMMAGVRRLAPVAEGTAGDGQWGAIAGWAWAMSRGLDWMETEGRIDARRVAVMGHSRLGKTSLWAGALDTRFALVISNDSGAGGAALSRRIFGETVQHLNDRFPHWFCRNYRKWSSNEAACPVDQHQLLALVAPRPLLVHSATEDLWADPKGEFLSCVAAAPVWELLKAGGLAQTSVPAPDKLLTSKVGYLLRTGPHDVLKADWASYLAFADLYLK